MESLYHRAVARREDPLIRLLRNTHLLSTLSRLVLERAYLDASGSRDLSFVQLNLLKFLDQPRPRTIGDVMRFMGASFPAASKAVGRLKRKGLVTTSPHPGDRRAQLVVLSPAGRARIVRYERVKRNRLRKVLAGTAPATLGRWSRALEELAGRLIRERALSADLCLQCGAYYSDRCLVPDRRCRVRSQ